MKLKVLKIVDEVGIIILITLLILKGKSR